MVVVIAEANTLNLTEKSIICSSVVEGVEKQWEGRPLDWTLMYTTPLVSEQVTQSFLSHEQDGAVP